MPIAVPRGHWTGQLVGYARPARITDTCRHQGAPRPDESGRPTRGGGPSGREAAPGQRREGMGPKQARTALDAEPGDVRVRAIRPLRQGALLAAGEPDGPGDATAGAEGVAVGAGVVIGPLPSG